MGQEALARCMGSSSVISSHIDRLTPDGLQAGFSERQICIAAKMSGLAYLRCGYAGWWLKVSFPPLRR
jgi:hypothetical protein